MLVFNLREIFDFIEHPAQKQNETEHRYPLRSLFID